MNQLIVRNVDPQILEALKRRASKNRRSQEDEHREILKEMLLNSSERSENRFLLRSHESEYEERINPKHNCDPMLRRAGSWNLGLFQIN